MPTDYISCDSFEQYADVCAKIGALYEESSAVNVVLCNDFSCRPGSRLYDLYAQLCIDLNVVQSDTKRLSDSFTYCNDSGTVTSCIDHILCSEVRHYLVNFRLKISPLVAMLFRSFFRK